ncbi:MAG TPA: site-specific integrase, partial [Rhodopila sp.]|nr:site-specific integrase [Rhodopila sp.]
MQGAVYQRAGSKFWQLRWTDAVGAEVRRSSGTEDYEEACKRLERFTSGSGISIQRVITDFFEKHTMKPKTHACYQTSLRAWLPFVQDLMLDQFDTLVVQKFVTARRGAVKDGTIRNDLAFMSSVLSFAMAYPGAPQDNPVRKFDKRTIKLADKRLRYLTDDEVTGLLACIKEPTYRLIALTALETGMRKTEILHLRLRELHIDAPEQPYILLPGERTKNAHGRRVPVSRTLQRTLSAHIATGVTNHLFVNPETHRPYTETRWFDKAVQQAGLGDLHFHDLRHHFASRYVQRGGRLQPLQEILGHRSIQMVQRYAHLAPDSASRE